MRLQPCPHQTISYPSDGTLRSLGFGLSTRSSVPVTCASDPNSQQLLDAFRERVQYRNETHRVRELHFIYVGGLGRDEWKALLNLTGLRKEQNKIRAQYPFTREILPLPGHEVIGRKHASNKERMRCFRKAARDVGYKRIIEAVEERVERAYRAGKMPCLVNFSTGALAGLVVARRMADKLACVINFCTPLDIQDPWMRYPLIPVDYMTGGGERSNIWKYIPWPYANMTAPERQWLLRPGDKDKIPRTSSMLFSYLGAFQRLQRVAWSHPGALECPLVSFQGVNDWAAPIRTIQEYNSMTSSPYSEVIEMVGGHWSLLQTGADDVCSRFLGIVKAMAMESHSRRMMLSQSTLTAKAG